MRRGRKNDPRWNLPFRDEPEADAEGEVLPATQPGPLEVPQFDDPETGSARQELGRRLERALGALSAQDRAIVLLALNAFVLGVAVTQD
jgi:DNA-directed RNA polymerase specialized sigma24 family protein